MFGAKVQRKEDPRLVSGQGRYLDDLGQGALAAAFVRSPYGHARILDIDVTDACEIPGVIAIYTYEDLDGKTAERLPLLIPHPDLTNPVTGYCLAPEVVNHVGEAVVMVVATDRYLAEDACARVKVAYEQLPVVVGLEKSRAGEVLVHAEAPGNVAAHMVQEVGDAGAAIAGAPHRLSLSLQIERSASMPMEGKGVYARWDGDEQSLRMYSSTQTSTGVRAAVAAKLGLPLVRSSASPRTWAVASGPRSCTRGRRRCSSPGPRAGWTPRSSGSRTVASTSSPRLTSGPSCRRSRSASTMPEGCSGSR